jgi:hypothetical protein
MKAQTSLQKVLIPAGMISQKEAKHYKKLKFATRNKKKK